MGSEARAAIPSSVKRILRQEAGFGCCKCGLPIIQYHHILPWQVEQHYRPEDMMVLCPTHHDQATKGALPEAEQRSLKADPFNIRMKRAKGFLEIKQDYCAADFGSVTVVNEGSFLIVDDVPLLGFDMGDKNLEISLKLYSQSDELLIEIERNEWVSGDPLPWDIEADWQTLTLRERQRKIALTINGKFIPLRVSGEFWKSGKRIRCNEAGLTIENSSVVIFQEIALVGLALQVRTENMSVTPSGNSDGGCIVSWGHRRERLWKARAAWQTIAAKRETPSDGVEGL